MISTSCTSGYGTYFGQGSTSLSNGTLRAAFCHYSSIHTISQVNIEYEKTGGSAVTLRFAWEWTDSSGSSSYGRQYDNGSFTETAGQTRGFTWWYTNPGVSSPNINAPCVRGVLLQYSGGVLLNTFSTRVVCGV